MENLPTEIIENIFQFLNISDKINMTSTNKYFRDFFPTQVIPCIYFDHNKFKTIDERFKKHVRHIMEFEPSTEKFDLIDQMNKNNINTVDIDNLLDPGYLFNLLTSPHFKNQLLNNPYEELPEMLHTLSFRKFGNPIQPEKIPRNIKCLHLHLCTDELHSLPPNLETLVLQDCHPELGKLPENLKTMVLIRFNQELNNLPANLNNLVLIDHYDVAMKQIKFLNKLPDNLNNLMIINNNNPLKDLPVNLKELVLINNIQPLNHLPHNLETLIIKGVNIETGYGGSDFCPEIFINSMKEWPNSIKTLLISDFKCEYPIEIKYLPKSIEKLYLGRKLTYTIKQHETLKELYFLDERNIENNYQNTVHVRHLDNGTVPTNMEHVLFDIKEILQCY